MVNGTVYWGSWDGFEHATSASGQARWATFLGKQSGPQCYPTTAGVASTATVTLVTLGGKTKLVVFVGGGDARFYALDAATGRILWATSLGSAPGTYIWGSPVVSQGHLYIGTASVGECPESAGRFFQLSTTTGAIERALDLVPQGCLGVGVWGSPTIDGDADELYIATSNASTCGESEPYAMSLLELRASTLTVVGSWQVPEEEAVSDGDFGSTPVLFTAPQGGISRGLVGAVNKNGVFYAFERGALGKGPVWRARISSSPVAGCSQCPSGDEAAAAWDGSHLYVGSTSTTIAGTFCYGSLRALDPATGAFLWERCLSSAYACWPRRLEYRGWWSPLRVPPSSRWTRRAGLSSSPTRIAPPAPPSMGRRRSPTACSTSAISTGPSARSHCRRRREGLGSGGRWACQQCNPRRILH